MKPSTLLVREHYEWPSLRGDVGIEIEMEGNRDFPTGSLLPPPWVATSDNSLRGHSVEYVTNGAIPINQVDSTIKGLKDILAATRVTVHKSFRAGVHIHINVREMNLNQVVNFACLYFILEHALVRYCGKDREGNLFCLRLEDAEAPLFFLENAVKDNSFTWFHQDVIRYASLNLRSISRHGSMEFRAMETNPDLSKISEWANLLYNIKEVSLRNDRKDVVQDISFYGPENWLIQKFGEEVHKQIYYDKFNDDVMSSLRNIQTLIYM